MDRQEGTENPSRSGALRPLLGRISFWLVLYTLVWALLSKASGWYLGLPFIVLATAIASGLKLRPWSIRILRLPRFTVYFLWTSLLGAIDVAYRLLRPRMLIDPGWERYPLTTRDPRTRLLISAIVGLMPGTLASEIENDELKIHLLDTTQPWPAAVKRLEQELSLLVIAEDQS